MTEPKPVYGQAIDLDESIQHLKKRDTMNDMAYVIRDWVELIDWLHEQGVPETNEHNVWLSSVEKVRWLINEKTESVEKIDA